MSTEREKIHNPAVNVLARYAPLASADFLLGVILTSSEVRVHSVVRNELERRLRLLREEHS